MKQDLFKNFFKRLASKFAGGNTPRVPKRRAGIQRFESLEDRTLLSMYSIGYTGPIESPLLDVGSADTGDSPTSGTGDFVAQGNKWGVAGMGNPGGTVTFSFVATGIAIDGGDAHTGQVITALQDFMPTGFADEIRRAFGYWETVANIQFQEIADGGGSVGTDGVANIRIGGAVFDGPSNTLAHGYYPPVNNGNFAGDIHFDTAENWTIGFGSGIDVYNVAIHEIGHAIGLDHSGVIDAIMAPFYQENFSGLRADDVLGVQSIYGVTDASLTFDADQDPNSRGNSLVAGGADDGVADNWLVDVTGGVIQVSVNGVLIHEQNANTVHSLQINGSSDVDNVVFTGDDGAIATHFYLYGGLGADTLSVTDINFNGSDADGLYAESFSTVNIVSSTFTNQESDGVSLFNCGPTTVTNSTFNGNDSNNGGFGAGMRTRNTGELTITNSQFNNNGEAGLIVDNGERVTLTNVTANNNGAFDNGSGVELSLVDDVIINNLTVNGNDNDGLTIINSEDVTVNNSTASGNDRDGFHIENAEDVSFDPNFASGNGTFQGGSDAGVFVDGADSFIDIGGNYSGNVSHGIQLNNIAGDVTLVRTVLNDNDSDNNQTGDGLHITGTLGGNLLLQGVTASDTIAAGLQNLGIFVASVTGNVTIEDSVGPVVGTTVSGNDDDGVFIGSVGGTVLLTAGVYTGNGDDGIDINNVTGLMTLTGVISTGNASDGFEPENTSNINIVGGNYSANLDDGIDGNNLGDVTLTGVTAIFNGDDGLELGNLGDFTSSGGIYGGNGGDGVDLDTVDDVEMTDDLVNVNGVDGVHVTNGVDVTLDGVTAINNGNDGVDLNDVFAVNITDGFYNNNIVNGIVVVDSTTVTLTNVNANGNDPAGANNGDGLHVTNTNTNTVTINAGSFSGNGDHGIELDEVGDVVLTDVVANDNDSNNGGTGSGLDADTTGTVTITGGTFNSNGLDDGIHLDTVGAVVIDGVTADFNDPGIFINIAPSVSISNTSTSNNNNGGVYVSNITGPVTLNNVIADENDADQDNVGDGFNATVVAGPIVVLGGSYSDPDDGANGDDQRNGIVVTASPNAFIYIGNDGNGAVPVTASGNEVNGIDIDGGAFVGLDSVTASDNDNVGFEITNLATNPRWVILTDLDLQNNNTGIGGNIANVGYVSYTTNKVITGSVDDHVDVFANQIDDNAKQPINYAAINFLDIFTGLGDDQLHVFGTSAAIESRFFGGSGTDQLYIAASFLTASNQLFGDTWDDHFVTDTLGGTDLTVVDPAAEGNDEFTVDVAANITATNLDIFGNGNVADDSANRDRVTILNNGAVNALTFDWSANGDFDLDVRGFAIDVNIFDSETIQYSDTNGNNTAITLVGQPVDDEITVAPVGVNSAVAFIGGDPFEDTSELPLGDNLPGYAGVGFGFEADLSFSGITNITVDGNGEDFAAGGDQLFVYGQSEAGIVDPVAQAAGYSIFTNLGFAAGELLPAVGLGNAYDEIDVSDTAVFVNNFVPVFLNPTDFIQANPALTSGLIVNAGDEAFPGVFDAHCDGLRADEINVALSFITPITVNGGTPENNGFNHQGDSLNIVGIFAETKVWADKSVPPTVSYEFTDLFSNAIFLPLRESSIECHGPINTITLTLVGDNNTPNFDQPDTYVVVGEDVDFGFDIFGDADGANELSLSINGSIDIPFRFVQQLNVTGDDVNQTGDASPDTLNWTPWSDYSNGGFPILPGGTPPLGWGIDTHFDEGSDDGDQTDLLITNGIAGVSEVTTLTPSDEEAGQVVVAHPNGVLIAALTYVNNIGFIFNGNTGAAGDTDKLVLKGTDGVTLGTSGEENVFVNYDNTGNAAEPFIVVDDNQGGTLYSIHNISNYDVVTLDLQGGSDLVVITDDDAVANGVDFDNTTLNVLLGAGNDIVDASASTSNRAYTFNGGAGNDLIIGGAGNDTINGEDGNDALFGGIGDDIIFGGNGNDTLAGGAGNDVLDGGDGIDTMDGEQGDDTLTGGNDGDIINVSDDGGADYIDGGAGADFISFTSAGGAVDVARPAGGFNGFTVTTANASPEIYDVEELQIRGTANNDDITLGDLSGSGLQVVNAFLDAGDDTVTINGRDTADDISVTGLTADSVKVQGLTYEAIIFLATTADRLIVNGNEGDDSLKAAAGVENVIGITLDGGAGNDFLSADAILLGGAGNDTLVGGVGVDSYDGGDGDDTLVVSDGADVMVGGAGFDTIVYTGNGAANTLSLTQAGNSITVAGQNTGTIDVAGGDIEKIAVTGLGGNDTITVGITGAFEVVADGGDGDDTIDGSAASVILTILGGSGIDTLTGGSAADVIDGGDGDDDISGGDGNDLIDGGAGDDTIAGEAGADHINGGDGDDTIDGGAGNDEIHAGAGNDTITVDGAGDTVDGGEGIDGIVFVGTAGNDVITVGKAAGSNQFTVTGLSPLFSIENLSLDTLAGADQVIFQDLSGTNLNSVSLSLGADADADSVTMNGRNTADDVSITSSGAGLVEVEGLSYDLDISSTTTTDRLTVNGNAGDDSIKANAGVENEIGITLNGNDGNDYLSADAIINGGAGNDTLVGGAGDDTLDGGTGDDILVVSNGADTMIGGGGFDTIRYNGTGAGDTLTLAPQAGNVITVGGLNTGSIDIGAAGNIDRIEVNGLGGNDTITVSITSAVELAIDGGAGNDTVNAAGTTVAATITGGDGNDTLTGGTAADVISGGAGDDTINGGAGNDTITGGEGRDTINGGAGDDNIQAGSENDVIVVDANSGNDSIDGGTGSDTIQYNGTAGDDVVGVAMASPGSAQFVVTGLGSDPSLSSIERLAINTLAGADTVTLSDLSSSDLTAVTVNLGADANADNLIVNATGLANNLAITSAGAGLATMQGLAYEVNVGGATTADRLTVNGGAGDDTIKANAGVENTIGITLNGEDGDDFLSADAILNGGAGNDTLEGGAGNDTYNGGTGDDILIVSGGDDVLNGDAGFDTIRYNGNGAANTLTVGPQAGQILAIGGFVTGSIDIGAAPTVERVEIGGLGGNDTITVGITSTLEVVIDAGAGNDTVNAAGSTTALTILGGDGNDTLTGGTNSDTISGGAGNDTINGGAGDDDLDGGIGDDTINGGAGVDRLAGGAGRDTLNGGTEADIVLGGEDNDTITIDADGAVDTIDGGTGTDTLVFNGTAGNDVFTLNAKIGAPTQFTLTLGGTSVDPADVEQVTINAQGGDDTVTIGDLATTAITAVNVDLGAGNVDAVTINGRNTADDVAISTAGAGLVAVQGLSYTLALSNTSAADRLTVNGNQGNDSIKANAGVEAQIGITLNGNDGDDFLSADAILNGGAGNDILEGGAGDDQLDGGTGDDILIVSDGNDTFVGGGGFDTIRYNGDDFANTLTFGPQAGNVIAIGGFHTGSIDITGAPSVEKVEILGFGGNDTITISTTTALELSIDAGDGDDTVDASAAGSAASITGGAGNDTITGSAFADYISGGLGDDVLLGGAGNDAIYGGFGNDILIGGAGVDHEYGEEGNDRFGDLTNTGNGVNDDAGNDFMFGGDGIDNFVWEPGDGSDVIQGGDDAADILRFIGSAAAEAFLLSANAGAPTHFNLQLGAATVDTHGVEQVVLSALGGDDTVTVGDLTATEIEAVDIDLGAAGTDAVVVQGRNTADDLSISAVGANGYSIQGLEYTVGVTNSALPDTLTVNGNEGDDTITGNVGVDLVAAVTLNGNNGNDTLSVAAFATNGAALNGNDGNDTLVGGAGADTVLGGLGDDTLTGNAGIDTLNGGAGFDTVVEERNADFTITNTTLVVGAEGTDTLVSIDGANLTGGIGDNTFFIGAFTGRTTITGLDGSDTADFSTATEAIVIDLDAVGVAQKINLSNREVTFADVMENLTATAFNDTINVDIAQFDRAIDGGLETAIPPGDRLNVDMKGSNPTTTKIPNGKLGSFDGTVNGSGYTGTINYEDIETLVIKNPGGAGAGQVPNFSSATMYEMGDGTRSVITVDLNGDGILDMVAANSKSNNIGVRLGDGFGAFGPLATFSAGGKHAKQTTTIAVGDVNGDGDLDIVVTNRKTNNVSVLFGNGAGSFGAATLFDTGIKQSGKFPTSVKLGDMDGDGDLDIVTANSNVRKNGSITVLTNNGAGGFSAPNVTKTLGRRPRDLVLIDVNGDGDLDVVATNLFSREVVVLNGNGAGGLGAPTSFDVGVTPNSIISGDFNGDGILDVVTTSLVSPRLSLLLGNGASFDSVKEIKYPAVELDISINTADIDGDGNLDLLIANRNDNTISYMLGNGNGTFDNPVEFKTGATRFREPVAIAIGDFNNDGALDLMVANAGSDDVSVLLHDPIV